MKWNECQIFNISGPSLSLPDQIRENCQEEAYSMVNKYNGAESPADKSPGESGRQDRPDSLVISEQDDGHDKQVHVLKNVNRIYKFWRT